jgi:hypothetical protein
VRSCRPSAQPEPGLSSSPGRPAGLKATNKKGKNGSGSLKKTNEQAKRQREDNPPSTCFLSALREARTSSAICCRLRTAASCSSRDWHRSSCETLSWVSSPLSCETLSYRCSRVACAPSSAARSC